MGMLHLVKGARQLTLLLILLVEHQQFLLYMQTH